MNLSDTLIHWGIPCAWPILCFFGLTLTLRLIQTRTIFRKEPKEGFPSDDGGAARVRFWKTEPLRMRETWKVKSFVGWGIIFALGGVIVLALSWVVL
jgi:hypothetical protein